MKTIEVSSVTTQQPVLTAESLKEKSLSRIAGIIRKDWAKVNYAAKPYLDAMGQLDNIHDIYGYDSGKSIVLYFLSNASTYRGKTAKLIKAELKRRVGIK